MQFLVAMVFDPETPPDIVLNCHHRMFLPKQFGPYVTIGSKKAFVSFDVPNTEPVTTFPFTVVVLAALHAVKMVVSPSWNFAGQAWQSE
jgi:hypothetical protein